MKDLTTVPTHEGWCILCAAKLPQEQKCQCSKENVNHIYDQNVAPPSPRDWYPSVLQNPKASWEDIDKWQR